MRKFCCCCSLRTGCICIAAYTIISGFYALYNSASKVLDHDAKVASYTYGEVFVSALSLVTGVCLMLGLKSRSPTALLAPVAMLVVRILTQMFVLFAVTMADAEVMRLLADDPAQYGYRKWSIHLHSDADFYTVLMVVLSLDVVLSVYFAVAVYSYRREIVNLSLANTVTYDVVTSSKDEEPENPLTSKSSVLSV